MESNQTVFAIHSKMLLNVLNVVTYVSKLITGDWKIFVTMPIEHIEVEDFVCCKLKFHAPVIKAPNFTWVL